MGGRRRQRLLSEEERQLWERVKRLAEPLTKGSPAGTPLTVREDDRKPAPIAPPESRPAAKAVGAPPPPPAPNGASKAKASPPPAVPEPFDPRIGRRIARGRQEIDARLDLHGLRQQDAYAALRRFLSHCQANGHRHVLVITGKGREDEDPGRDLWSFGQRGVLRRLVPQWLAEPSFRLHVVSFTQSSPRHGGSGALYVTIRKEGRNVRR